MNNQPLEETKKQRWSTSTTVQDLVELAVYVSRHRWKFIICCVALFASSFYFYHTRSYYTSRISFLVNSSNLAEVLWDRSADSPIDVFNDDRGFNRINQIIYSSQMIDYLINQFDLYSHYRIDKKDPNSYLMASTMLKTHIGISLSKTRIITVQISDRLDYNVAANIANAIGQKINDFNRKITVESLARKTEIFESLSKDLRSNSSREISQIDSLLKSMQHFITTNVRDDGYRQLLLAKMENVKDVGSSYFKNLYESYKYRLYSMYSLQEKNLPTISVLEKALPDKASKHQNDKFVYPVLLVFAFLVPLFFAYILMKAIPLLRFILQESAGKKERER